MCGIGGFLGSFSPDLLNRMSAAMSHRGPDDDGVYFDAESGVGLAHRRLSIIDLSSCGRQPMWDVTRTAAIVFNGEIYNYRELRAELGAAGFRFRSHTDTEVLLNLYLRDGEAMLSKLNGMFAFAIWDTRTRALFLARDGLGVKPLYYARTADGFLFASEMKALLEAPGLDRSISAQALRNHLTYLWSPAPETILASVKKLEPGHAMIVRDGTAVRTWRYYSLSYDQPLLDIPVSEAADMVRDSVSRAVERQMVADVPVGAFLSGGLDSSAVVAFARTHAAERRLQCFTIALDRTSEGEEGTTSDLPYAQAVARHLDVDLHTVHVGPEAVEKLPEMLYALEEPQADPATLNVLFIARLARHHGIKVLLSGAGGDDIFTGYRRHLGLALEPYWRWLPRPVRGGVASIARRLPGRPEALRRIGKALQYADLEGDARLASYFHWLRPHMVSSLLTPDMQGTPEQTTALATSLADLGPAVPSLNRMLYLEARHFLADHNLLYTDKMSMAAGVEVRVPLLDVDLVNLATRLPLRYKQRRLTGKWIFRKAMEGILPDEVIYRAKTGFGAPLRSWLRGPLRPMLEEHLSAATLRRRGWFEAEAVHRLLEADRRGRVDAGYPLFAVLCAELWAQSFLDRPAGAPAVRPHIHIRTIPRRTAPDSAPRALRVGIDLVPAAKRIGGGWHYAKNLLHALAEHDQVNDYVVFVNSESAALVPDAPNFRAVQVWDSVHSRYAKVVHESLMTGPLAAGRRLDVIHYLFGTLPVWSPTPTVVTMHDLKTEERPWDAPPMRRAYIRPARRRAARRAAIVAAVSRATAHDLHTILRVPWSRIEVVPSPMAQNFTRVPAGVVDEFRQRHGLPTNFWLYVANVRPHKNHRRLLEAHRALRNAEPHTWPLVLCGDAPEAFGALLLPDDRLGHVRILTKLADAEMPVLYSAAGALIFPSLFEGGGMPVMEALACGCAVVASDIPTTREFAGEAALTFDPSSVDQLRDAMRVVQHDEALREQMRAAGQNVSSRLSPATTAAAMVRAYRRAVGVQPTAEGRDSIVDVHPREQAPPISA
jgi:asparagine synthase (glutamine-hydrolysing)